MKQTNVFGSLALWKKFVILGLVSTVLTAVPYYYFFAGQQEIVNTAVRGQQGLEPTKILLQLMQALPRHRGSSSGILNGNDALIPEEKETRKLVNQYMAGFEEFNQSIEDPEIKAAWQKAKASWPQIVNGFDGKTVTTPQNFDAHTQLITQIFNVLTQVQDFYGLSRDSFPVSNFLIKATFVDGVLLTEYLGQTRGWGTSLLAKTAKQGVLTLQERTRLTALINLTRDRFLVAIQNIEKAVKADPNLKPALEPLKNEAVNLINAAIELSEKEISTNESPTYSSTEYYQHYTQAIDKMFKLIDVGSKSLDAIYQQRVDEAKTAQFTVTGMIAFLFVFATLLAFYIVRSITFPVLHLVRTMNELSEGNNKVRSNLQTTDEIGILGRQFDAMLDQRELANAKIQEENEQLNSSVIELLTAVAKLSQKDLTARVPVAEDVTGLVADALNLLADETAKVMNRVVQIAHDVADVSQQVKSQSDTVINVAFEEKREVEQAAAELSSAALVMMDIAKLARACNEAAERTIQNTEKAQGTVLGTVQGITTIRDTIRETEKRIKRLGERSQEIGGVVNLINGIAERTHILALNASMHAASAGEAGRGFAVVANEVQRLAENSREATSKIAALVNNIQVETADTVTTMNDAISQVVKETELAQQAGSEMRETRDTTANLVQLVQRIATSSEKQAHTSQRLRERAEHIQKSTEQTYEQLQAQGLQTEQLVNYSKGLVESVGVFILPEESTRTV